MNEVVVRVGGPDDVGAAVAIFVRTGNAQHPDRPVPEWRIDQVAAAIRAPSTWFFVADDDTETVGMAVAMPSRENEGAGQLVAGLCYLDLIFVVPERWGQGIGALLLDTVIEDARLRGFTRIHLLTHDDNERAHGLYASRGFERTGWSRPASDPRAATVSDWARDL